jgi:hypothetical protein
MQLNRSVVLCGRTHGIAQSVIALSRGRAGPLVDLSPRRDLFSSARASRVRHDAVPFGERPVTVSRCWVMSRCMNPAIQIGKRHSRNGQQRHHIRIGMSEKVQ